MEREREMKKFLKKSIMKQNYCLRSFHSICAPEIQPHLFLRISLSLTSSRLQTCSFAALS